MMQRAEAGPNRAPARSRFENEIAGLVPSLDDDQIAYLMFTWITTSLMRRPKRRRL
jgi:hypothetical protein